MVGSRQSGGAGSRWVLVRGAAAAREGWRRGLERLPDGAWRRWAAAMAIGYLVAFGATVAVTETAKRLVSEPWDRHWLQALGPDGPLSFVKGVMLESPGNLLILGPVVLVAAYVLARRGLPMESATIVAVYLLQRPLVLFGRELWARARPDSVLGGVATPGVNAFPSGHAALSLSAYGFLAYLWIRSSRSPVERLLAVVVTGLLAVAVGWARLILGTHWPSDILGGWIIAAVWLLVAVVAVELGRRGSSAR